MTADDLVERELMFNRFRRLITELMRGGTSRTVFQAWEVDLLVDIESCNLDRRRRTGTLRHYLRMVERQLEQGPGPPMRLSEFLQARNRTRRPSNE